MTRFVTVSSLQKRLSVVSAPWPDPVSPSLIRRARVDNRLHSLRFAGSAIPISYTPVRTFSSGAFRGAMGAAEDLNASAASITGAEDASVQEVNGNGNKVPPGMPAQDSSLDPESEEDVPLEAEELQDALTRPPAVNSSYLPLPWQGRLGYVRFL